VLTTSCYRFSIAQSIKKTMTQSFTQSISQSRHMAGCSTKLDLLVGSRTAAHQSKAAFAETSNCHNSSATHAPATSVTQTRSSSLLTCAAYLGTRNTHKCGDHHAVATVKTGLQWMIHGLIASLRQQHCPGAWAHAATGCCRHCHTARLTP
jgi:hypothetical protein